MEDKDQLAMHYRQRLNEAEDLLKNGNKQGAKDICCDVRLKPDVVRCTNTIAIVLFTDALQGVYARARLNLMLAQIHAVDIHARKYAYECIDLLDLYRQMYTEATPLCAHDQQVFTTMENACKDIIDETERGKLRIQREKAEGTFRSRRQWVLLPDDGEIDPSGELKIEGFLRVGRHYKEVAHYVPLSRTPKLEGEADTDIDTEKDTEEEADDETKAGEEAEADEMEAILPVLPTEEDIVSAIIDGGQMMPPPSNDLGREEL